MVQDQTNQIQAKKEKYKGNQSNIDQFNDVGETVSDTAGSSLNVRRVIRKQLEKLCLVNHLKSVEHLQRVEHQYHLLVEAAPTGRLGSGEEQSLRVSSDLHKQSDKPVFMGLQDNERNNNNCIIVHPLHSYMLLYITPVDRIHTRHSISWMM